MTKEQIAAHTSDLRSCAAGAEPTPNLTSRFQKTPAFPRVADDYKFQAGRNGLVVVLEPWPCK